MDKEIKKFLQLRNAYTVKWKLLPIAAGIVLLLVILELMIINSHMLNNNKILHNIIQDNNQNKTLLDKTTQSLVTLSRDANEIRNYLGFSRKQYPVFDSESSHSEETNDTLLLYMALEKIFLNYNKEKNTALFNAFKNNQELQILFKDNGLQITEESSLSISISKDNNHYFIIQFDEKTLKIQIIDFTGKTMETDIYDKQVLAFMQKSITDLGSHYQQLQEKKAALARKMADSEIINLLKTKKISISKPIEEDTTYKYMLLFSEKSILNWGINKKDLTYFINNQKYQNLDDWKKNIIKTIDEMELLTDEEQQILLAHKKLQAVFNEKAFLSLLDANDLTVVNKSREEHYFSYYDIIQKTGLRIGSFAIDNFTGDIYIMDKDDLQISSINMLLNNDGDISTESESSNSKKKIEIPEYIPEIKDYYNNTGLTFLICGSNETNTDTIIIANIDNKKKVVTLFAIPRDLYYHGRRINSVYYNNGAEELLKAINQITGLKIEKYIHINMFAFIDVINILGGIDITLDNDLIDPTYKIKENGQWSTLYYKKGTYHFNGIQALRVARSRHFTSDFDRSKRQQKVLVAIRNQFSTIGIAKLDKISTIASTILKYVKTNFTIFELLQYFSQYKNFSIRAQHTLDTTNILDATYTNLYLLNEEEKQALSADKDFDKGGWILIPKNNDWNTIKWYIRELLK